MDPRTVVRRRAKAMAVWGTLGAIPGWLGALYLFFAAFPIGLAMIVFLCIPGTMLLVSYFRVSRGTIAATERGPWTATAIYNGVLALSTFALAAASDGPLLLALWAFVLTGITWLAVDTAHRVVKQAKKAEFAEAIVHHGWGGDAVSAHGALFY